MSPIQKKMALSLDWDVVID